MFDHDDVIYDDKNHKMLYWQMKVNEFKIMKQIQCQKCKKIINVTLGYYSCEICFHDLCKKCATQLYGGKEISLARVRPIVHRVLAIEDVPIIIQADRESIHDTFAKVYGEVKAAGGKDIHFATKE